MTVNTLNEYQETAIRLGRDRAALAGSKQQLIAQRYQVPLFNTQLFARNLERVCFAMWEQYIRGEVPTPIALDRA